MATKSMEWYVNNLDFEGAKERFENTSPNWKKKWFAVCEEIYKKCKDLAKKYILNPLEFTIQQINKVFVTRKSKYSESIQIAEDCDLLDNATQKCYLFTFYDDNDNMVCSKIGTTTRKVRQRLREELTSQTYKKMGCTRAVINRVYDCGEIPAEGLESYFRAMYIKQFPESFKKNDRFMNTWFDLAQADKIVEKYLG